MLLILAPGHDSAAMSLASRWASHGAILLTIPDLSAPGWEMEVPSRGPSRFIAGGQALTSDRISGVLTRLPGPDGADVEHVAEADRAYVSSEITAFLLAWLSSLECPVLNRPTPGCLCGPNWRIEQWIHLAATLGIPVAPVRRSTVSAAPGEREGGAAVTVVGERCIGEIHPSLAANAKRLAAAAHVDLLELRFTSGEADGRLYTARLCPDVSRPELGDALLEYFRSRNGCA